MSAMHVTMSDVGRAAGVHHTTVSLALRGHRSIPPATRDRVRKLAESLGYRPNPLISALMGQRCRSRGPTRHATLAYLVAGPQKVDWRKISFFRDLFVGASARAQELGYKVEAFRVGGPTDPTPAQLDRILSTRNIHGVLIGPLPYGVETIALNWAALAAVSLSLTFRRPHVTCVSNDHFPCMRRAIARCRELGYERIGFFMSAQTSGRLQDRWLAAYQLEQASGRRRHRVAPLLYQMEDTSPPPIQALSDWLIKEKPEAVICRAFDARAMREPAVRSITRGIGVVALDVPKPTGTLAGIYQHPTRIGAIGAEMLIAKLQRNECGALANAECHLLGGEWVDGETLPPRESGAGARQKLSSGAEPLAWADAGPLGLEKSRQPQRRNRAALHQCRPLQPTVGSNR
jgi:LacI family transcriptional regulator